MFYSLSILSILAACGEKESTTDTGQVIEDTSSETVDTGAEDTDSTDTDAQDTTDTTDTNTTDTSDTNTEDTGSPTLEDLDQPGPHTASSTSESATLSSCDSPLNYTPVQTSVANAPTVLIAHGFLRSSSNMIDWGGHLASWGLNALVVDMCNFADHEQNGIALAELASNLGIDAPLYMGFSAGGLASLVAAANSNPLGVLTLDPVDDMNGTGSTLTGQ